MLLSSGYNVFIIGKLNHGGWHRLLLKFGNKNHKEKGQNGHFWMFLGLSLPNPASSLPGPWNAFILRQPARLGELPLLQMAFSINNHSGGRVKGLAIEGTEGKMQGEREEEKSKVEAL